MKWLVIFLLPLLFATCIEPYDFEADVVDQAIVVDAELSDSLYTQEIKISYLNRVGSQQFEGVPNARVLVEDDLGEEFTFEESTPGVYRALFGADRARKYRLNIAIPNGGRITSDFQGVPPPIQIDSVTFDELKESFVNEDGKNRTINVIKAYGVANITNNEQDLYLRFGNIETVFLFAERKTVTFPPPKTCFVYNKDIVPEIGVFEVKANSDDVAVRSLLFTKPVSWEFGTVFSIKADLISMDRPHFDYWKEIELIYSQDGNINNPPPARIRSNLSVENRPPVIGYFGMTSISSDVVFIRKADLNTPIILRCGSLGGPFPWPYPEECNECLFINGATTSRPEYW
ncbi:MAG: DUF4249 domain-containing protein [Bacteroidota bacterium]